MRLKNNSSLLDYLYMCLKSARLVANSVDPDQMLHSVVPNQGPPCLLAGLSVRILRVKMLFSNIQSTLVISKSKGPSEIFQDSHTSTYQICRIEENMNRTTTFHE